MPIPPFARKRDNRHCKKMTNHLEGAGEMDDWAAVLPGTLWDIVGAAFATFPLDQHRKRIDRKSRHRGWTPGRFASDRFLEKAGRHPRRDIAVPNTPLRCSERPTDRLLGDHGIMRKVISRSLCTVATLCNR